MPLPLSTSIGTAVTIDMINGKFFGTLVGWTCKGINLMIARVRLDQDVPVVGQPGVIAWKAGYVMDCNPAWVAAVAK